MKFDQISVPAFFGAKDNSENLEVHLLNYNELDTE